MYAAQHEKEAACQMAGERIASEDVEELQSSYDAAQDELQVCRARMVELERVAVQQEGLTPRPAWDIINPFGDQQVCD